MKKLKIIISLILIATPTLFVFAETTSNSDLITQIKALIEKNNTMIKTLEDYNKQLQTKLDDLNKITSTTVSTGQTSTVTTNTTSSTTLTWSKASSVEKYNIIIDKINSMSPAILAEFRMWTGSSIWLFEFIEPSNFFISIDDWNNPTWVTAFKKKILYKYDDKYNFEIAWTFDLDYNTQYYITKSWKNPFAKATRIRIKNPNYKWKLLDISTTSTSSNTTSSSSSSSSNSNSNSTSSSTTTWTSSQIKANVTAEDVATAYSNNKILDAIKLSDEYIKKDPNNTAVLKIRYRSYAIVWKYTEALAEVEKYIQAKWSSNVEKWVYCEAKNIAKLWKNTSSTNKYTPLCAGK